MSALQGRIADCSRWFEAVRNEIQEIACNFELENTLIWHDLSLMKKIDLKIKNTQAIKLNVSKHSHTDVIASYTAKGLSYRQGRMPETLNIWRYKYPIQH